MPTSSSTNCNCGASTVFCATTPPHEPGIATIFLNKMQLWDLNDLHDQHLRNLHDPHRTKTTLSVDCNCGICMVNWTVYIMGICFCNTTGMAKTLSTNCGCGTTTGMSATLSKSSCGSKRTRLRNTRTRWTRRARDLGHIDNLLGNREIQDPQQGVCDVLNHLRHRKVKNLHVRADSSQVLRDVPLHPVLPASNLRQRCWPVTLGERRSWNLAVWCGGCGGCGSCGSLAIRHHGCT